VSEWTEIIIKNFVAIEGLGYRSRGPGSIPGTTRFSEKKIKK
jgi:hypothetical protein